LRGNARSIVRMGLPPAAVNVMGVSSN